MKSKALFLSLILLFSSPLVFSTQSVDFSAEFKDKITIHVGSSQKILRTFLVGQFDFIYIDGSHQAPDVLEDTLLAWRLLKKGGILIWDDYDWGEQYQEREKPKVAIDAFLYIFEGKYKIISSHRQICVTKLEL